MSKIDEGKMKLGLKNPYKNNFIFRFVKRLNFLLSFKASSW